MALASAGISTTQGVASYPSSHTSIFQTNGLKKTTRALHGNESFSLSVKCVAHERGSAVPNKAATATSLYTLLWLDQNVSLTEIKRAYRKMALKCHPDVCPASQRESTRMFLRIQDAYEQLSDPQKREQYDYELVCQRRRNPRSTSNSGRMRRSGSFSESWRQQWEQQLEALRRKKAGTRNSESWGARMRRTAARTQ